MCPVGAAKAWILADKQTALPWYMTEEDKQIQTEILLKFIFFAPSTARLTLLLPLLAVALDRYDLHQPVFFAGCTQDYVCLPVMMQVPLSKHCKDVTYKEFDSDHWLILSRAEELNKELLAWIKRKI